MNRRLSFASHFRCFAAVQNGLPINTRQLILDSQGPYSHCSPRYLILEPLVPFVPSLDPQTFGVPWV